MGCFCDGDACHGWLLEWTTIIESSLRDVKTLSIMEPPALMIQQEKPPKGLGVERDVQGFGVLDPWGMTSIWPIPASSASALDLGQT